MLGTKQIANAEVITYNLRTQIRHFYKDTSWLNSMNHEIITSSNQAA